MHGSDRHILLVVLLGALTNVIELNACMTDADYETEGIFSS